MITEKGTVIGNLAPQRDGIAAGDTTLEKAGEVSGFLSFLSYKLLLGASIGYDYQKASFHENLGIWEPCYTEQGRRDMRVNMQIKVQEAFR